MDLRYGKKEGFTNLEKKRVHDAGTRFQQDCPVSVHENVREYEEAGYYSIHAILNSHDVKEHDPSCLPKKN